MTFIIILTVLILFSFLSIVMVVVIRDYEINKYIAKELGDFNKRLYRLKKEVEDVNTVDKRAVVDKILTCIEDLDALKQLRTFRESQAKKSVGKMYTGKGAKFID